MIRILFPIAYLCAIGFCSYTLCWLAFKASRNRLTGALAACQVLVIIWCVPQLFLSFPMTRGMKYVLYAVSYMGISLIGPAWLMFSAVYCGHKVGKGAGALFFGLSAFDYSMLLTNEIHHLFYQKFEIEQVLYGPVFYVHMLYTYVCVILGMFWVLKEFWQKRVERIHMVLIILAAAVPLGFNLLYLSGLIQSGFDLTPPAFALSSFFMLLAVFRYDFLDVNLLAFEYILESIGEGVIVCHKKGRIAYCNQAASRWLGVKAGDDFPALEKRLAKAGVKVEFWEKPEPEQAVLTLDKGEKLQLKQYICRGRKGEALAGIFLLADVGEYYKLMEQEQALALSSRRLAVERERNRIAQEVHDTAGHTLVMIQSLIKLIRREWEMAEMTEAMEMAGGKPEEAAKERLDQAQNLSAERAESQFKGAAKEYLDQAQALSAEGIRELRQAINRMHKGEPERLVTEAVLGLAGQVKEIPVEVEFQGEDGEAYSHLSQLIHSCLQEGITNCLKYAHASRMDVIVKFEPEALSLYLFDDGQGCKKIQESHGIRGIRQRVSQAGGQARVISAEGEGFQIYVRLPLGRRI